jgi:hypothetical protein
MRSTEQFFNITFEKISKVNTRLFIHLNKLYEQSTVEDVSQKTLYVKGGVFISHIQTGRHFRVIQNEIN